MDARLLEQFARDRFLQRFAGLDEARQRREEARRETALTPDEDAAFIFGEHDHDRVDAREMFGVAAAAAPPPAAAKQVGRRPAHRAEAVPRVTVDQAA